MILRFPAAFLAIIGTGVWLSHSPVKAEGSLADLESYRAGCQSLSDGRYETATTQFLETWDLLSEGAGGDLERDFVASRLLESLVRNGETARAAEWLKQLPLISPSANTLEWAGIAFYEEERYTEAADTFSALMGNFETKDRKLIRRYLRSLALSRSADDAISTAQAIFTPENYEESVEIARIAVLANRPDQALETLDAATPPDPLSFDDDLTATRISVAALIQANRADEAVAIVCEFIDRTKTGKQAAIGFLLLEEAIIESDKELIQSRISTWTENENHPAAEAATFFENILFPEGIDLATFLAKTANNSDNPFQEEARLRLALHESGKISVSRLEDGELSPDPSRSHFAAASVAYRQEQFREAAQLFLKVAESQIGASRSHAAYNAAISSLQADDLVAFDEAVNELKDHNPRSPLIADLSYLGGLYEASQGAPNAFVNLQNFIRDYPQHPATVEARLALSEIHLNQVPARPQAARDIFEELKTQPLTLTQNERLDYTSIWVERIDNNFSDLTLQAEDFLTNWPNSAYLPEIAMLLGTQCLKDNNLEAAREKFDLIVQRFPESIYADAAKFFAAKAGSDGDESLVGWQEIAASESQFADQARHEIALLLLSQDQYEEARFEMEALMKSLPENSALRYAVLADLGYSYYLESLNTDDNRVPLEKAAETFARLSNIEALPVAARYNGAVRRAKCLEALGRPKIALEIYRSMISEESGGRILGSEVSLEENEWIFRAGFSAIDILKENKDWEAAIKIADTLSLKEGPRAIEAGNLAEQLRLKHWVWD